MVRRALSVALGAAAVAAALSLGTTSVANAGGGCRGVPATTGQGTDVYLQGACFRPTVLYARPGETITWTNEESLAHTVTGANTAWGDYTELGLGGTASHRFDEAGTYPYFCLLHPGMIGAVVVGDGPAPADGSVLAAPALVPRALQPQTKSTSSGGGSGIERWAIAVLGIAAGGAGVVGVAGFALGRRRSTAD